MTENEYSYDEEYGGEEDLDYYNEQGENIPCEFEEPQLERDPGYEEQYSEEYDEQEPDNFESREETEIFLNNHEEDMIKESHRNEVAIYELEEAINLESQLWEEQVPNNGNSRFSCEKLGSLIKRAVDGFGGSGFGDIIGNIGKIAGGNEILTNLISSGRMESAVEKMLGDAAHTFLGVNPATGAIIGAIAGNLIFNMGGKGNSLGCIGKVILDNIISGKYHRDVESFVSPIAIPGSKQFGLDFYAERDRCLQEKILFEDPEFPASNRSLYYKTPPKDHIEWKRPGEIVAEPQLIVGEQSRFDVKQGALGDCWLLAAVANLTLRDELFYRVVPPDQSFTENYAGIFHFQFWRYGKWTDVVIDDRLPTVNGRLYYMHSDDHQEFWSALIEKAYAKLYGSYENLEGGTTAEALEDFTGGLTEFYDLQKIDKSTLLTIMVKGFRMGSLFGCSIDADSNRKEAILENGLVCGHAYSITALQTVTGPQGETIILRIRNPWGNSKEWNGAWSDGSNEWNYLSEEKTTEIGLSFAKDGEFWMSFDDFYSNFMQMEICNLSAEIMNDISEMIGVNVRDSVKHQWEERAQDGEWNTTRGTAGGCTNHSDTYFRNPQFSSFFAVTENSVEYDGKCTVIIAVLQKYRREMRTIGEDSLPIGFSVYQTDQINNVAHGAEFFHRRKPIASTPIFINMREVTCRFRVFPGHYVIVPCTFDQKCDGEFLLRIYASGEFQTQRLQ